MASNLKAAIKARTAPQRGQPYTIGAPATPELPELQGALPEPLQVIARNYIGARRRSGEALLDAARWLGEARAQARHGEWQIFLEATHTSETTAGRLLDIHAEAMRSPQFAEAIMRNWLTFTAAAELAAPSTPPDVRQELLSAPAPPSRADVRRAVKSSTVEDLTHGDSKRDQQPERRGIRARRPAPDAPDDADEPAYATWRDAIQQLRGAHAQAHSVQRQAQHFTGQQRRTLREEIDMLIKELQKTREALG